MKFTKGGLKGLLVSVLLVCVTATGTHGQDMSVWLGKWFKMAQKFSGYEIDYRGMNLHTDNTTNYLKIRSMDESGKVLHCDLYMFEDGEWRVVPVNLHVLGNDSLEFLCWYYESDSDGDRADTRAFTFLIQGKMSQGSLASAKMKSLGATQWIVKSTSGEEYYRAGGYTFTGSLIPESKLPPDIPK
jgi:hypothetical protein